MATIQNEIGGMANSERDRRKIAEMIAGLDARYGLGTKIEREPGVAEIVKQMAGRLIKAYGELDRIRGQRVLDIACGSSTSKAPPMLHVYNPFGGPRAEIAGIEGYTAQFEPWFCRMLAELEAEPVGIDIGEMEGEVFEHHRADLGAPGALDFLPDHSFDAVQDSRLFGSPEFTAQFPERVDRVRVAGEIHRQEMRILKPGGLVIHSDAEALLRHG